MRPALYCALALTCACATAPPPPAADGVLATIEGRQELSVLARALADSGMRQELAGRGPYTVFAPTDAAFAARGASLDDASPEQLRALLRRHVVRGRLPADALASRDAIEPLDGQALRVRSAGDRLVVEGAAVVGRATASNGLLHVVDAVFPPAPVKGDRARVGDTTGKKGGPDAWWW